MTIRKILLLALAVGVLLANVGHAQQSPRQILFAVPSDTTVLSGRGDDLGIFVGRPVGTTSHDGTCGHNAGFNYPVQNVIFVHPQGGGGSTFATAIVFETTDGVPTDPIAAGTRMIAFASQGDCTRSDGALYNLFLATLQ